MEGGEPALAPEAEELAKTVLQDIEDQAAALRFKGADRDAAANNAIVARKATRGKKTKTREILTRG